MIKLLKHSSAFLAAIVLCICLGLLIAPAIALYLNALGIGHGSLFLTILIISFVSSFFYLEKYMNG